MLIGCRTRFIDAARSFTRWPRCRNPGEGHPPGTRLWAANRAAVWFLQLKSLDLAPMRRRKAPKFFALLRAARAKFSQECRLLRWRQVQGPGPSLRLRKFHEKPSRRICVRRPGRKGRRDRPGELGANGFRQSLRK